MLKREPFPLSSLATLPLRINLPSNNASYQFYVTAMFVLSHFFGLSWLERWVMGIRGEKGDFLKNSWSTPEAVVTHQLRVLRLAEMLLNLQDAPYFWEVLEPMIKNGVEVGFSELEAGQILKMQGIRFAFRKPIGERGSDYDLDIDLDGLHICGETKCKLEKTVLNTKSFLNSVETARSRNLPSDRPGAVYIKVPQLWFDDADFHRRIEEDVEKIFNQSGRLIAVIITCAAQLSADEITVQLLTWKTLLNDRARLYDTRVELLRTVDVSPGNWFDLIDVWGPYMPAHNHLVHSTLSSNLRHVTSAVSKAD